MSTRTPTRRTQWPAGANDQETTPITVCPTCGMHSSGVHTCRAATTSGGQK